jgi:hypothetical protein
MKPTNSNKDGCSPISSNCVIWQGPDIECINLCKGDTVSDVVYALATELCSILEQINIDIYDLSCLNLIQQDPADFQKLIQLLIDKICELEGIEPGSGGTSSSTGCPDCKVDVAFCLIQTDEVSGNPILKEQLTTYVERIGLKICDILNQIADINLSISNLEDVTNNLQIQINNLVIPDPVPLVTPSCVTDNPGTPQDVDVVLAALEQEYCDLRQITGDNNSLLNAIVALCSNLGTNLLTGNPIQGFVSNPTNIAELLNNMALKICDTTNAITYVLNTCCDTSCSAIDLGFSAELISPTQLRIIYSGTVPGNFVDDAPSSSIEIIDTVTGLTFIVPTVTILSSYFNPGQPQVITLGSQIDGNNNINVKVTYRFTDPSTQQDCSGTVQNLVLGAATCPDVVLTPTFNTVQADFTYTGGLPTTLIAQVYDVTGVNLVATQTFIVTTATQSITLSNLIYNTDYKFALIIDNIPCDFVDFTTPDYPCIPPSDITFSGNINDAV